MGFTLAGFLLGYLVLGYVIFYQGLYHLGRVPMSGPVLSERIFYLMFFFFFLMLVFSNAVISYTTLDGRAVVDRYARMFPVEVAVKLFPLHPFNSDLCSDDLHHPSSSFTQTISSNMRHHPLRPHTTLKPITPDIA